MWIREMHYKDECRHTIEYHFICQSCRNQAGPILREITALHERRYPGHFSLSTEDQAVLPAIVQNKLANVLLLTWIAFERGEYHYLPGTSYLKEPLVDYGVNRWQAVCPHCGAKQEWVPKKKLFGKSEAVDPHFLPTINWRWEALITNLPERIECIKREKPQYLIDRKAYPLDGSAFGLKHSSVNDDEGIWRYVVPGLHLEFVKDLMDDDNPPYYVLNPTSVNFSVSLPKKNKPEFNKGEEGYGFVGFLNGSPVTRWAICHEKAIVGRTCVMPFEN